MRHLPVRPRTALAAFAATAVLAVGVAAPTRHHTASAAAGTTELPTEWRLSAPDGPVQATGTLPESVTLSADRRRLIVVDAGAGPAQIQILDPSTLAIERTIPMKGVYGVPLADRAGAGFWVSTAAESTIEHLDAATGTVDRTIAMPKDSWPSSIARSPNGTTLAVADETGDRVAFVDLATGAVAATPVFGAHLADVAFSRDGKTLYVASWGGNSVYALDPATHQIRSEIPVGRHPEHLLLSPHGERLYVAETDEDAIGVIDLARETETDRMQLGLFRNKLGGLSPTAMALAPDGSLYVASSSTNAVVIIDPSQQGGHVLGALPTGWYPTAVSFAENGRSIFVADGMGESGRPNPQFRPFASGHDKNSGYVASSMIGSIRRIDLPDSETLAAGVGQIAENGPWRLAAGRPFGGARTITNTAVSLREAFLDSGTIKHVIYIIKENRTYDQVLGDETSADGDAQLTLFGRDVTPNEHAIAERFGIFDRTFADAEVSADGHNWSTAAFANDYLEKMWPPGYGGRRDQYDFEDHATASIPHGGYLWNDAKRSGVSLRNYGEFTSEPDERQPVVGERASDVHDHGITSSMPDLRDETDPRFPGFDLDVSDLTRVAEWKREYDAYIEADTMPSIEIMRLPNDHTGGTRAGMLTPKAFVAQNDDAVGRLVDRVSHGPYWKSTAIFILEDDAQNGADHVDAQRMTLYVASPYTAGGVQHRHYSTAGVLATIEAFFHMQPMSAYDASAEPLYEAFQATPDLRPYRALRETQSEIETNAKTAYHARENLRYDLSREDAFPERELNDEIWHAVAGHAAPRRDKD